MDFVNWFSKTILSNPAWIIGFIVVIGYALLGKKWYEVSPASSRHPSAT